jgi:hypothetical protein
MKSKQVSITKTNINSEGELELNPEELLMQLKQRETELSLINSVQHAIMAEMDLQEIYDLVGDKIREKLSKQISYISHFTIAKPTCYIFHTSMEKLPNQDPLPMG